MRHGASDLLERLDELDVPDLWAEISARTVAASVVEDSGPTSEDQPPPGAGREDRRRGRNLLVLAAAAVALVVAAVVVIASVLDGDQDSNRVITEQPETPVTVETPATTVEAQATTVPPPPTTDGPPPTTSPAVPETTLAAFASPPEYGYPFGTLSCCAAAEDFQFTLLGSPGTADDPFSEGDLLIMIVPRESVPDGAAGGEEHSVRGTTGYSGSYFNFPNLGFTGDLAWAEAPLGVVVLASRSHETVELVAVADSLEIDEASGRFIVPEGFVPIADQGYDEWLGPLSSTPSDHLTYSSTWTTGGRGDEETIYVKATPASDGVLILVEYLVEDSSRVPVRGTTGVLGTYGGSKQLSWIEDDTALVTVTASDPTVDLIAMAESDPPEPWSPAPDLTVLSGSDYGVDWNLIVKADRGAAFLVCFASSGGCSSGVAWRTGHGFDAQDGAGNSLSFVGGRAPACATSVRSTESGESAPTAVGPDGHPYFMLAISADGGTSLEALDDGGGVVATREGSQAGWPDDIC